MTVSGVLGAFGVFGSPGLPKFAGDALDKACEVLFDKTGKEILEEVQSRLRAYTGSVPPNHDLEHAIRLSELTAALVLLEHYRRAIEVENFDNRQLPPLGVREWLSGGDLFIGKARAWLFGEIGLCPALKLKPNDVIVAEINASLDRVLTETRAAAVEQGLAEACDGVWAAMIAGAGPAPLAFEALFHGRQEGEPGWSVLFLAFIREALKKNSRAEIAFVTTRLSSVREALRRVETHLNLVMDDTTAIRGDVSELRGDVSELLALIRQNQLIRRGSQEGVLDSAVQSMVKYKYFDTRTREIIRSKFSLYRQEHEIGLPELAKRIEEHLGHEAEVSAKTLRRFMKGIRVDDSFVALLTSFADTLISPPVPTASPIVKSSDMYIELAINERAETIVFHSKPFHYNLNWLEFNSDISRLKFVILGGFSFDIPVRPELAGYMSRAHRALMVLMDQETGQPIEGDYRPVLVLKATDLTPTH